MGVFEKLTAAMAAWTFVLLFVGAPVYDIGNRAVGRFMLRAGVACAVIGTLTFVLG